MRIAHKLLLVTIAMACALIIPSAVAQAAEINPEAGTYTSGSTSELSAYQSVSADGTGSSGSSDSSSPLANTGQNAQRIMLLVLALFAVAGGAVGVRYALGRRNSV